MPKRRPVRIIGAILGIALVGYLMLRAGSSTLLESLHRLGWGLALIIALGGVSQLVRSYAWRLTLAGCGSKVSLARLFQLRLVSEAAGQVGAMGLMFGEGVRVSAMSQDIPMDSRVSSVTLDRAMFVITGAVVSVFGIIAALLIVPVTNALLLYAILFAAGVAVLLCLAALAVVRRWPLLSAGARAVGRIGYIGERVEAKLPLISSIENRLFDFHNETPFAFHASLTMNTAAHALAVLEVYLILFLLGAKAGAASALVFEGITKLVGIAGLLSPGNVGTYEGGNVLIAKMFALPAFTGLAIAVARRARAIFWTAAGVVCFFSISRLKERSGPKEAIETGEPGETKCQEERSMAAFIVLNDESGLFRVGTLPILLRTILAIKKAGAQRIIAYANGDTRRKTERELLEIGRLPHFVDWLETRPDAPCAQAWNEIAGESQAEHLLLVDGSRNYQPALLRQACEWRGEEGALLLTTDGQPIGIQVLSSKFGSEAAICNARTLGELQDLLVSSPDAQREEVPAESWQKVATEEDRVAAESKLDGWLVKPTDGNFARFNRRISVPISRQLIKLPITPNMVSIFTLGVGLAAGIMFARAGYWNMVIGAVLSVFASILDGCDGEVARLRLMESDFGCWLETVCDWLYYLFVFAGIAIGLSKTLGPHIALFWGSLLLFGALMSFLVTGLGRRRYAAERPEQYLAVWHVNAEKRRSNPILYLGRNMEFMVRRCFMPYALLAFAMLNLLNVVFFLATIGANIAWLVSLYSYIAFALSSKPKGGCNSAPEPAALTTAE